MKEDLRKKYLLIRKNISAKKRKDEIIYHKVINHALIQKSSVILLYVSLKEEVDTINLIKYFLKTKKVAVPKINGSDIEFYYLNSLADLKRGSFNIWEPINSCQVTNFTNSICLVPGICFNRKKDRIGYGKGYYDRFLSQHNIYAIGLTYQECIIDDLFADVNDQKVNEIITD